MGYAVVDPDDLEPWEHPERDATLRSISDATDLTNLGVHRFEADPGEQLPLAYHYHEEQEELFYVLSGTLTAETPTETYEVEAGEAFVVEPESPQRTYNDPDNDEGLSVLAIGAPRVDDVQLYED